MSTEDNSYDDKLRTYALLRDSQFVRQSIERLPQTPGYEVLIGLVSKEQNQIYPVFIEKLIFDPSIDTYVIWGEAVNGKTTVNAQTAQWFKEFYPDIHINLFSYDRKLEEAKKLLGDNCEETGEFAIWFYQSIAAEKARIKAVNRETGVKKEILGVEMPAVSGINVSETLDFFHQMGDIDAAKVFSLKDPIYAPLVWDKDRAVTVLERLAVDSASLDSPDTIFIGMVADIRLQQAGLTIRNYVRSLPDEMVVKFLKRRGVNLVGLPATAEGGRIAKLFYGRMAETKHIEIMNEEISRLAHLISQMNGYQTHYDKRFPLPAYLRRLKGETKELNWAKYVYMEFMNARLRSFFDQGKLTISEIGGLVFNHIKSGNIYFYINQLREEEDQAR